MFGLVIGRFNIPHEGHVSLIKRALKSCERVTVALSTSKKNSKAADWYLRVHAFTCLLTADELLRVDFTRWSNITTIKGFSESTLFVALDNASLAETAIRLNVVNEAVIVKKLESDIGLNYSSTKLRTILDNRYTLVNHDENSDYMKAITLIRYQEIQNNYD